jgi:hypothetical protein
VVVIAREWLPELRKRWRGLSPFLGGVDARPLTPSGADRSRAEVTSVDDVPDVEQTLDQRN